MKKRQLSELAGNPKYISGIYNYCDRWCSRCQFRDSCLSYAIEQETFGNAEETGMDQPEFWQKLLQLFQETREMVEETAREMKVDIEAIEDEALARETKKLDNKVSKGESIQLAQLYAELTGKYYLAHESDLREKETLLNQNHFMNIPGTVQQAAGFKNALETIGWYRHFICVKLLRALTGKLQKDSDETDLSDANGSAKVSLIAIDNSLAAWDTFMKNIPNSEDDILEILATLSKLRKLVEGDFPQARDFVRPGFDELKA
jgi:hypothetical protein